MAPLLALPTGQVTREVRRAREREAADLAWRRESSRVLWQCVLLGLLGIPVYALSWHLTDPRESAVAVAAGYCVMYVAPWLRWLIHHIRHAEH